MKRVYHGSILEVSMPLVSLSRQNLNFGPGFYVTDLREQAEGWAKRMGARRLATPIVSVYDFDRDKVINKYHCLRFEAYDKAWLDFIAASRKGDRLWSEYDMIEGGVANDRVIDTVEDYIHGRMSANAALAELARHQPNNQICILNQEVVDRYLHFVQSEVI